MVILLLGHQIMRRGDDRWLCVMIGAILWKHDLVRHRYRASGRILIAFASSCAFGSLGLSGFVFNYISSNKLLTRNTCEILSVEIAIDCGTWRNSQASLRMFCRIHRKIHRRGVSPRHKSTRPLLKKAKRSPSRYG